MNRCYAFGSKLRALYLIIQPIENAIFIHQSHLKLVFYQFLFLLILDGRYTLMLHSCKIVRCLTSNLLALWFLNIKWSFDPDFDPSAWSAPLIWMTSQKLLFACGRPLQAWSASCDCSLKFEFDGTLSYQADKAFTKGKRDQVKALSMWSNRYPDWIVSLMDWACTSLVPGLWPVYTNGMLTAGGYSSLIKVIYKCWSNDAGGVSVNLLLHPVWQFISPPQLWRSNIIWLLSHRCVWDLDGSRLQPQAHLHHIWVQTTCSYPCFSYWRHRPFSLAP